MDVSSFDELAIEWDEPAPFVVGDDLASLLELAESALYSSQTEGWAIDRQVKRLKVCPRAAGARQGTPTPCQSLKPLA